MILATTKQETSKLFDKMQHKLLYILSMKRPTKKQIEKFLDLFETAKGEMGIK